jgi:hypothetical protein
MVKGKRRKAQGVRLKVKDKWYKVKGVTDSASGP